MKKFYLSFLLLLPLLCHAEKVLTSFTDEDGISNITYDADGHVTDVVITEIDEPDFVAFKADWSNFSQGIVKVTMSAEFESISLDIHVDNNGRATEVIYTPMNIAMYKFSYDAEGHITSIIENMGEGPIEKNVIWNDGNIVKITGKTALNSDKLEDFTVDLYYTDDKNPTPLPNLGGTVGNICAFSVELDDGGIYNVLQILKLTGISVKDLPLKEVFVESRYNTPSIYNVEYTLDAEGYPIKITEREERNEVNIITLVWGDIEAGITDVVAGERTVVGYYNLNGVKLSEPCTGINIVCYSDGTCDKVIVR